MADATPSRSGQVNQAGDALALFLKISAGEVLTAFDRESAYRGRHRIRVIPNGKSAQFPRIGLASAYYHVPGQEITGENLNHAEVVVPVEDLLIAPVFIPNIDEAMNHYDVRAPYNNEIGQALAKTYDKDVSRTVSQAARQSIPTVTGLPGGSVLVDADYDTDGVKLYQFVADSSVLLDQKDIPKSGRNAGFKPVQYALIVRSEKPIDTDLNPEGNGSIASGMVRRIFGIPLFSSNNMAQEDDRANTAIPAARREDFSVTMGQVFHESAAASVHLQDVTMESGYDMRRQGTLMLGKYLVGHRKLREESAIEAQTAAPAV